MHALAFVIFLYFWRANWKKAITMKNFESLSELEISDLLKAPVLVAVLISGADDDLHTREIEWAKKLISYRDNTADLKLQEYYTLVDQTFSDQLDAQVEAWQEGSPELISAELAALNPILAKLDPAIADLLKDSWRSLAVRVAEAMGGVLGFGTQSTAEKKYVDLPMLQ